MIYFRNRSQNPCFPICVLHLLHSLFCIFSTCVMFTIQQYVDFEIKLLYALSRTISTIPIFFSFLRKIFLRRIFLAQQRFCHTLLSPHCHKRQNTSVPIQRVISWLFVLLHMICKGQLRIGHSKSNFGYDRFFAIIV